MSFQNKGRWTTATDRMLLAICQERQLYLTNLTHNSWGKKNDYSLPIPMLKRFAPSHAAKGWTRAGYEARPDVKNHHPLTTRQESRWKGHGGVEGGGQRAEHEWEGAHGEHERLREREVILSEEGGGRWEERGKKKKPGKALPKRKGDWKARGDRVTAGRSWATLAGVGREGRRDPPPP